MFERGYFLGSKKVLGTQNRLDDIITKDEYHQNQEEYHSYFLCVFQELIRRLSARDHLIREKHDVTAIQCGNGQ